MRKNNNDILIRDIFMNALPLEGDTLSFVMAPWLSGRFLVLDLDVIPPKTCFSFLIFLPVNLRLALLCWTLLVLSSLEMHVIVKYDRISKWMKNYYQNHIQDLSFLTFQKKLFVFFFIIESSVPNKSREKTCQYTIRNVMFSLCESIKATDSLRRRCMVNVCFASMATKYGEQIEIYCCHLIMYRLSIT